MLDADALAQTSRRVADAFRHECARWRWCRARAAPRLGSRNVAGRDLKTVVAGKVDIARIEHRCRTDQTPEHRRFKIIDDDFCRDTTKRGEGVLVAGEKMLHGLGDGELDEHLTTEGQYHDEEREPATCIADGNGLERARIDLAGLSRSKVQLEIDWQLGWPDVANVIAHNGRAAAVSFFTQTLKDLLGTIGVGV